MSQERKRHEFHMESSREATFLSFEILKILWNLFETFKILPIITLPRKTLTIHKIKYFENDLNIHSLQVVLCVILSLR